MLIAAACVAAASPAWIPATSSVAATPPTAAAAATARLQQRLRSVLRPAGRQTGALVENVSTGAVLYSSNPSVARPPASVEKLYTTVAALNLLGPDARFTTEVLATGKLGPRGVWRGNLYLRGGGDPTLGNGAWNREYEDGHGPTVMQIAAQLQKLGIRRVTGHIFADESLFDTDRGGPLTGNQADIPDYGGELSALVFNHGLTTARMSPAVLAAHELALTMRGLGMKVGAAGRTARTPAAAHELAHVESPALATLVRLMDVPSDDLIADMLAKQLGAHFMGAGTLNAGATEIAQTIATDYHLQTTVHDGSGLDRADSTSPTDVVDLLRQVWMTPTGDLLYHALPVVGKQGTVQTLGLHSPAAGHCVAKTGTLNGVTNLAGYCPAGSGQTLAFALMLDGPSNYAALPMLSRAVAAIARY